MHTLQRLTEHIVYLPHGEETDRPVLGLVYGKNAALMVDAGNSAAHAGLFLKELEKTGLPKPGYAAVTHWHWDHVFGLATVAANANATTIAHEKTREKLAWMQTLQWDDASLDQRVREGTEIEFCSSHIKKEMPGQRSPEIVLPDIAFRERIEVDLGNITCIIQRVGGDHAPDSSVIYVPQEKVLFTGDCIYPDLYSEPNVYTMETFAALVERLFAFGAEWFVDSHKEPLTREAMRRRCDEFMELGRLAGSDTETPSVVEKYKAKFGREPDEDDLWLLECFIAGNRKGAGKW